MKFIKYKLIILLVAILLGFFGIEATWREWNDLKFNTPFKDNNRTKYKTLYKRTISTYGAHRNSYVKGHKHAGIDLRGKLSEKVYAIAKGKIVDIQLSFPHLTVLIKHEYKDLKPIYSRYTHVEGICVKVGDEVDSQTSIARLFNKKELKESRFSVNHLHIEIRKRNDDDCRASWTSMTMKELNEFCINPLKFFKNVLD